MNLAKLTPFFVLQFLGHTNANPTDDKNSNNIRGLQKGRNKIFSPDVLPDIDVNELDSEFSWVQSLELEGEALEEIYEMDSIDIDCYQNPELWECLRFTRVSFPPEYEHNYPESYLPLTKNDYPAQGLKSLMLKESTCPSVILLNDPGAGRNVTELIETVGGEPTHPSCDLENPFWLEFEEVVDLALVKKYNHSTPACMFMELPDLWSDMVLEEVAEAVHDEVGKSIHHIFLLYMTAWNIKV